MRIARRCVTDELNPIQVRVLRRSTLVPRQRSYFPVQCSICVQFHDQHGQLNKHALVGGMTILCT